MLSPCLWKSFDKDVAHLLVLVAIQTGMASEKSYLSFLRQSKRKQQKHALKKR